VGLLSVLVRNASLLWGGRIARRKQQDVEGALTEAEFEQRVDTLVSNDSIDEVRAARERRALTGLDRE
jgi:hypothetical protein